MWGRVGKYKHIRRIKLSTSKSPVRENSLNIDRCILIEQFANIILHSGPLWNGCLSQDGGRYTEGFRHRVSLFGDKGARQSGWVYLTMFIAPWAILHDEMMV